MFVLLCDTVLRNKYNKYFTLRHSFIPALSSATALHKLFTPIATTLQLARPNVCRHHSHIWVSLHNSVKFPTRSRCVMHLNSHQMNGANREWIHFSYILSAQLDNRLWSIPWLSPQIRFGMHSQPPKHNTKWFLFIVSRMLLFIVSNIPLCRAVWLR